MMKIAPLFLMFSLMISCGRDASSSARQIPAAKSQSAPTETPSEMHNDKEETYRTIFVPLNGSNSEGTAEIKRISEDMKVRVTLTSPSKGLQKKYIAPIKECPTAAQDGDADGLIEETEIGAELMPLENGQDLPWESASIIIMAKSLLVACGPLIRVTPE
jgi:hypothetical protein